MRKLIITLSLVLFALISGLVIAKEAKAINPVAGYWKSVDDKTKKPTGYWRFEVKSGTLYGYLVSYPNMKSGDKCDKCKGKFKNLPIIGTPWLKLKKYDADDKIGRAHV